MNKTTLLVIKDTSNKIRFHKFILEGSVFTREWGLIGGVIQGTTNAYGFTNEGKANELSPEETALLDYERVLSRKIKEGYVITEDLENLPDLDRRDSINLNNIPIQTCCSKPKAKIAKSTLQKLIQNKKAKFFIKYNGLCHYILNDLNGDIKIFTRRWNNHTAKYPALVQEIKNFNLPKGTLLIAELVIDPNLKLPHMQAFKLMSSISKSDTLKGECKPDLIKTMARQKLHRVRAVIFGILYYDNQEIWNTPYSNMFKLMQQNFPYIMEDKEIFIPKELPIPSAEQAFNMVKKHKSIIEGFVVWDMTQTMRITMNGKPDRCAAYKVKAKGEKDVIADGWIEGSGNLQGKIGSLCICQYDDQGNRVDLGTVGGLKPKEGECDIDRWTFPCVIEVEYDQIFPDTGKFQFGHFNKIHEDKLPSDVEIFSLA